MDKKQGIDRNISYDKDKLDKSLRLLVKTSFVVFIGLVLSKILAYTYRITIARYYGPEAYGLFSLALTVVSLFGSLAAFGLLDGLSRYIPILRAKNKFGEIRYLFGRTLKIYAVLGIISTIVLIFISDFISESIFHNSALSPVIKIMALGIFISLILNVFVATIRAFEEIGWYSFIYNILQNLARVIILVALIWLGLESGADAAAISFVASAFLILIASYWVCKYKIEVVFEKKAKTSYPKLWREFFSYSWPVLFYSVFSFIFYWIDTFSLGYYKSASAVGLYHAAVPIAAILGFMPELFMQLFFPMINREYSSKNYELIRQLSKQVTKWIFAAILPIFALLFLFPGAALNIIFGSQYLAAENALRILLIGSFVSAMSVTAVQMISMIGKSKLVLANIIIASILNLILNSLFVPMPSILAIDNSSGLAGAALATLISIVSFNLLFIIETKKYLSFVPFRRKMITIALLSIIPIAILYYLRDKIEITIASIIFISFLFFLVYIILILTFRAFDKNDWMIINALFGKLLNLFKRF